MPTAITTAPTDNSTATLADVLLSLGALDKARADQIKLAEIQTGDTQENIIRNEIYLRHQYG